MNVRMWLVTLCCGFVVGMATLFFTSTHMSTLVFTEVTIPQLSSALQAKYEYGLKSVVDVAAQDVADRLKGITDPKEQYALIEKHTDYQRFFLMMRAIFLLTKQTAHASMCQQTRLGMAKIL